MMKVWLGLAVLLTLIMFGCESTNDTTEDKTEKILYYTDLDLTIKMYSMNPDGSNKKQIYYEDIINAVIPKYSPDKSKIAFVFLKDNYFHLGVIKADGTGFSSVEAFQECLNHSWSPDGTKIVFSSKQIFVNEQYLVIATLKDDKLEGFSASIQGHYPKWLPNSNKLIYRFKDNMYSINIDGTEKTKLIDSIGYFDCSPDGSKIVFNYYNDDNDLYIMNSDGSNIQKFTDGEQYPAINPIWSPDGEKILYRLDCSDGSNYHDIIVVKYVAGSSRYEIKDCGTSTTGFIWSPNSERIAFSTNDNSKQSTAYVINIDGSGLVQLTSDPASFIVSDWK